MQDLGTLRPWISCFGNNHIPPQRSGGGGERAYMVPQLPKLRGFPNTSTVQPAQPERNRYSIFTKSIEGKSGTPDITFVIKDYIQSTGKSL